MYDEDEPAPGMVRAQSAYEGLHPAATGGIRQFSFTKHAPLDGGMPPLVSAQCQAFIRKMMAVDPAARPTARSLVVRGCALRRAKPGRHSGNAFRGGFRRMSTLTMFALERRRMTRKQGLLRTAATVAAARIDQHAVLWARRHMRHWKAVSASDV